MIVTHCKDWSKAGKGSKVERLRVVDVPGLHYVVVGRGVRTVLKRNCTRNSAGAKVGAL